MPLDPKKIVDDAKRVGLIGFVQPVTLPPLRPVKSDRRTGKRVLRGAFRKRYVITKNQLEAQRPNLKLP